MEDYRNNYPNSSSNSSPNANNNLLFYRDQLNSKGGGLSASITTMHNEWCNDYSLLESHHAYIQWLFPLREASRFNNSAQILQLHEMQAIQQEPILQSRFLTSLTMMLNFWGAEIKHIPNSNLIKVIRCEEWRNRLKNTRTHGHNNMRITRMLKCCGELGFEHYKLPILEFFIHECFGSHPYLSGSQCVSSCRNYWVPTLRNETERTSMMNLISTLENSTWVSVSDQEMNEQGLYNDSGDIGRTLAVRLSNESEEAQVGRIILVGIVRKKGPEIRHKIEFQNGSIKVVLLKGNGENGKEFCFMKLNNENVNQAENMVEDSEGETKEDNDKKEDVEQTTQQSMTNTSDDDFVRETKEDEIDRKFIIRNNIGPFARIGTRGVGDDIIELIRDIPQFNFVQIGLTGNFESTLSKATQRDVQHIRQRLRERGLILEFINDTGDTKVYEIKREELANDKKEDVEQTTQQSMTNTKEELANENEDVVWRTDLNEH